MKNLTVLIWLSLLLTGILALFWHNEWKYKLPTPVPANYKAVKSGTLIELPKQYHMNSLKPVFLHFFNPDCPCSKFNMAHFKSIVKQYREDVDFTIVVMNNTHYSVKEIQDKFGIDIPVCFDTAIATLCGVYSTPQALLLNKDSKLYYRGNYNKDRYCTDRKTSYAKIALNALLKQEQNIAFDQHALKAYGCQLPVCTNR